MVAPKIAIVTFSLAPMSLDELDKAVAIIKEHSSHCNHQEAKTKHRAWLDRMILGKCWLLQDDIKARTNWETVCWDRFWGRGNMDSPGAANSMSNRDTISDKEVLATLSGFQ